MPEKRTGAKPRQVDGITFYCWRIGILKYEWRATGQRITAGQRGFRNTYYASVGNETLPTYFRSLENAMRAAIKHYRKNTA